MLDQTLVVNGHPMTIVGVSAQGFNGIQVGATSDVMVPMMMKSQMTPTWNDLDNRRSRWVTIMGRLKPGITAAAAGVPLDVVYKQINEQEIQAIPNASATFRQRFCEQTPRGAARRSRPFGHAHAVFHAAHRVDGHGRRGAAHRVRERRQSPPRAIDRAAEGDRGSACPGAGRGRIARQHLIESLLLAGAGAVVGLALAMWTGRLLLAALPGDPTTQTLSANPDARVIAFTLLLALVTALLFGIGPALSATRAAVVAALKEEAGGVVGGGRQARVRRALVVGQVALSMLLLAGAGLFARSLFNLRSVDPGFSVDRLLTFAIEPSLSGYDPEPNARALRTDAGGSGRRARRTQRVHVGDRRVHRQCLEHDGQSRWLSAEGRRGHEPQCRWDRPSLLRDAGRAAGGRARVHGQGHARRAESRHHQRNDGEVLFRDANPIGRRFGFGRGKATDIEIVGVVRDLRTQRLNEQPPRFVYIPYLQDEGVTQLAYLVRSSGDAGAAVSAVRQAVQRLDPNLPLFDIKPLSAQVSESLYVERMVAALSVTFGALATMLAAIGLYGVMSYAVARRTREIGIRMALGAERGRVMWLVLKEVALLAALGVGVGLAAAFYLTRQVQSQLFGLSPHDPATLAGSVTVLLAVALLAGFIPARRATTIDPLVALKAE